MAIVYYFYTSKTDLCFFFVFMSLIESVEKSLKGLFFHILQVVRTTFLFVKRFCIIHYYMACRSGKKKFFAHKIFFWYSIILFLSTWSTFFVLNQLLLLTWNTFFRHQITFCATSNFSFSTQNYFSCNAKFLLWTSFRMLCHGDIFLFSHSNRNIITCQKKK